MRLMRIAATFYLLHCYSIPAHSRPLPSIPDLVKRSQEFVYGGDARRGLEIEEVETNNSHYSAGVEDLKDESSVTNSSWHIAENKPKKNTLQKAFYKEDCKDLHAESVSSSSSHSVGFEGLKDRYSYSHYPWHSEVEENSPPKSTLQEAFYMEDCKDLKDKFLCFSSSYSGGAEEFKDGLSASTSAQQVGIEENSPKRNTLQQASYKRGHQDSEAGSIYFSACNSWGVEGFKDRSSFSYSPQHLEVVGNTPKRNSLQEAFYKEDYQDLESEFDSSKHCLLLEIMTQKNDYSAGSLEEEFLNIHNFLKKSSQSSKKKFWIFMEKYQDIARIKCLELIHSISGERDDYYISFLQVLDEYKKRILYKSILHCPVIPFYKDNRTMEEDYNILSDWILHCSSSEEKEMAWNMLEHGAKIFYQ
ncbi:hypothetical protein PCANC_23513 [Puccinia coronata f. sp. avenae]|uniref:Uncharacterized protein n=1 Tax=Puccinia coronata f. sp. avenae TaxID=200324 RepID=A0A2N5TPI9_9BASI|nr:hypothetical protein PCANC_23513 [Puccinia coronata f. sp. avenae]